MTLPTTAVEDGLLVDRRTDSAVAVLTMRHRPHNLLGPELIDALIEAFQRAEHDGARAVVLLSDVRHFSAGADLDAMVRDVDVSEGRLGWRLMDLVETIERLQLPVIAGVHGACLGGGLELALACDLVVAAESAKLGAVEATVGLHPLMGGFQRIAQRAGLGRAKEMALLARRYDARTMERWNVVNRVVPDEQLVAATMTMAHELAAGPTVAHGATKVLARIAVTGGVGAADEAMAEVQRPIFQSADFAAGVASFKTSGPGTGRFEGR